MREIIRTRTPCIEAEQPRLMLGRQRSGVAEIEAVLTAGFFVPLFFALLVLTVRVLRNFDHMHSVISAWPF